MANTIEEQKISPSSLLPTYKSQTLHEEKPGIPQRPPGWKYRAFKFGSLPPIWYASPEVQLVVVAMVCFLGPGMWNALSGMGGGGQVNHGVADDANSALYSTFAVVGFFAGTIANVLGIRYTLAFGGLGYSVYIASFLCYSHTQNFGFTIFGGALLGFCAALLWTAQGAILMSYPPEGSKGKYISWFWTIFNSGAVIGSLIPLGQNIHVQESRTVTDGTYIGFLVLTLLGTALAWCLIDAKSVLRQNGSRIILMKNPTWKTEVFGLCDTFRTDAYIILLFPMFFASNWFYAYYFNDFNGVIFSTRARALNNTLYYIMEIVGAFVFGYGLDRTWIKRTTRARLMWFILLALTMAIWGSTYILQKTYTRAEATANSGAFHTLDWTDAGYIGPMFLYLFYGFYDAAWTTCIYWIMGSLTNNGRKLANFAGFFKGIQSAGAAIMWRLDSMNTPYMNIFASCWALLAGSLLFALPVILFKIKDQVPLEDDLEFTDEALKNVVSKSSLEQENEKVLAGSARP